MRATMQPAPADQTPRTGASRFARLAAWSQRHHWTALVLWVVVLAGVTAAAQVVGSDYRDDHSLPGTESERVLDVLDRHAPARAGDTVQVVLADEGGLMDAATRERVQDLVSEVAGLPAVASVESPYGNPAAVSPDGTIGYAVVTLTGRATDVPVEEVRALIETARGAEGGGLQVALGGDAIRNAEEAEGGAAEGVGMLAALVVLVLMFGSLLAASLPLITAVFAVGSTLGVVALASNLVNVPTYTAPLMMLVGLGVGIDYALLVFARYRGEILAGNDRATAGLTALDTAGRSVLFAGCTVIVSLLGLYALGLGSLQGVALSVALTVLVTMLASLTLLPSLLTVFGRRIERRVLRRAQKADRAYGDRWRRWGAFVQRRPWAPLLLAVAGLVVLCLPTLDMRLGFADAGTEAPSSTSRQAYDLLAEGFGPGFNGPLVVVADGLDDAHSGAAEALHSRVTRASGIAAATPPQITPNGEAAVLLAFPTSAPQDAETSALVSRLRQDVLPPLESRTGATYLVGGSTAAADDFAGAVQDRLPLFLLVVVGLSSLLLVVVFRSVLVPLKAAVLNLLSIGASLGVVTLVFGEGMLGAQPGPVEAFVPVMVFAIVFGLSMDYEVFLVSRMHEEWRRTGRAHHAVREGLATTGGVITAAAAIMIAVFGAFVLSPDRMLQQFGLGLAVAVFLDAVVVRCLVVPAVMRLLGVRAWWLPSWLGRVLPRVALDPQPSVSDGRVTASAGRR